MRLSMLDAWRWRLMTVQIDCRDALEVIRYWDSPDTLFYVDPPYVTETRKDRSVYALRDELPSSMRGLSSYCSASKAKLSFQGTSILCIRRLCSAGWEVHKFHTACSCRRAGAGKRVARAEEAHRQKSRALKSSG
jgi:DNA adenine methylase